MLAQASCRNASKRRRPLLRPAHVRKLDHGHPLQPQLSGGQHPAVPGNDAVLPVDQYRVGPAKLPDAGGDLRDLGIGVVRGLRA
jgi:hypothetical protein